MRVAVPELEGLRVAVVVRLDVMDELGERVPVLVRETDDDPVVVREEVIVGVVVNV